MGRLGAAAGNQRGIGRIRRDEDHPYNGEGQRIKSTRYVDPFTPVAATNFDANIRLNVMGSRCDQNTPTNREFSGKAATATVAIGTVLIGSGGAASQVSP